MSGCKYCTANEPTTSLGEWLFDGLIEEEGDLEGCTAGIVIVPKKSSLEFNVVNLNGVGDTTIDVLIKYCPMCGRKMDSSNE